MKYLYFIKKFALEHLGGVQTFWTANLIDDSFWYKKMKIVDNLNHLSVRVGVVALPPRPLIQQRYIMFDEV